MTNDLYRVLGSLEAGMTAMQEKQDEAGREAKEHRDKTEKKIDEITDALRSVQADIADIKPIANQMKQARSYVVAGFIIIVSVIGAVVWLSEYLVKISRWLGKL